MKYRLDQALVERGMVASRSQAESYIKLGKVKLNGRVITKAGLMVSAEAKIELTQAEQYVSRAALKLASVADKLELDFSDKVVLDVGSSTGGFTDYALRHGAKKIIAVDVGTKQLHPSLVRMVDNRKIFLLEQTDIRNVYFYSLSEKRDTKGLIMVNDMPDIVLIDVSFISLREILPHLHDVLAPGVKVVAMVKPQFEAGKTEINKGVVKNDTLRRKILRGFETWAKERFVIGAKADSDVAGASGNLERFYLLRIKS